MSEQEIKDRVDAIIAMGGDYEVAHSEEDHLHRYLIRLYCPEFVNKEINRLDDAPFARHCA